MNDPRLRGSGRLGQIARKYSGWNIQLVRTVGSDGKDASTFRMTETVQTFWNSTNPTDNVIMSRNGRNIFLLNGNQVLMSFNDAAGVFGSLGYPCGGVGILNEPVIEVPNDIFETVTDVGFYANRELFFGCR